MTQSDPVLARIPEGIELRQQGRNAEARALFEQLWTEVESDADRSLHRCMIAHSIADAQDEVSDELRWDLTALDAVRTVTDEQAAAAGMGGSAAAFLPSLHLNLAECYCKLGDTEQARAHLEQGRESVDALPDGDYGAMIRSSLDDLAGRLSG